MSDIQIKSSAPRLYSSERIDVHIYIFIYIYKALIEIHIYMVHHLSITKMSCSFLLFYRPSLKNLCYLLDIGYVDCLDEVYNMLLCRIVCCLSGRAYKKDTDSYYRSAFFFLLSSSCIYDVTSMIIIHNTVVI
jgi:hypothetical protein